MVTALQPEEKGNTAFLGDLSRLNLLTEYRSIKENPVLSFYRPCLLNSNSYKRAVGYFRSTVFYVIGSSMVEFARRGGKVQIICSPRLSPDDIDVIAAGYGKRSEIIESRIIADIEQILSEPNTYYPAQVLATLISSGNLDIKLAMRADRKGLYHEKIGIFGDGNGNRVSFKGSTNETWNGWHYEGNIESIEVFCSWRDGLEAERVNKHEKHFDTLWSENDPDIEVFHFPVKATDMLKRAAFRSLDDVENEPIEMANTRRKPLPHQENALTRWAENNYRGIFEHATGSGKTFTAIIALKEHIDAGKPAIVLVPSKLLLEQWAKEIRDEIPKAALLLAGAGNTSWKKADRLQGMTRNAPELGGRIVLSTMPTAATESFLTKVVVGEHLLVVADEVHQIGSPKNSKFLSINSGRRLGLSATPKRYGDPDGTNKILNYFGEVILPKITLYDAIQAGRLVQYEYYPHPVNLTATEAENWKKISDQISLEMAKQKDDGSGNRQLSEKAKMLLIKRSRIAKKAEKKVQLALEIIKKEYEEGQHWLLYCEDSEHLSSVLNLLKLEGYNPIEYHSNMPGDADATMSWFRTFGGPLVSIRCLDEGVDIPAISHALILASSQNPRQFIQRRGRVLRKMPGKHLAVIHDAVVVPVNLENEPEQISLLKSELLRSIEFAKHSINKTAAAELRAIATNLGFDPDELLEGGFEDEENGESEEAES